MINGVTNYSKSLMHYLLLLSCLLFVNSSLANSTSVNVYLKLEPENNVALLIRNFNAFLAKHEIFKKYQITPYLEKHPLHITLYMSSYKEQQIPEIIQRTKQIAQKHNKMSLLTSTIIPNRACYVMLSVVNDSQLQSLSNKLLMALFRLRDPDTQIPAWAKRDAKRKVLFNQYGSPSVLNYFEPHFSILSADDLNKFDKARLYAQLTKLAHDFDVDHLTQIRATATAIGVGIANKNGQIEKELASFSLE